MENDQDETNIAKAVVDFIMEIGDVYERAQLARSLLVVGDAAATPGFAQRLAAHVNAQAHMTSNLNHARRSGQKDFCNLVDTPFAADCVMWTGAAILSELVCPSSGRDIILTGEVNEDEDRIS